MYIQKLRKFAANLMFLSPMCLAILFVSINPAQANPIMNINTEDHSGEELFRGIFFAEGNVASSIPYIKDLSIDKLTSDKNLISQVKEDRDQIVADMKKANPNFFSDFKSKLTSGNHLIIKSELTKAGDFFNQVMENTRTISEEDWATANSLASQLANSEEVQSAYKNQGDLATPLKAETEKALGRQVCLLYGAIAIVVVAIAIIALVVVIVWKYFGMSLTATSKGLVADTIVEALI